MKQYSMRNLIKELEVQSLSSYSERGQKSIDELLNRLRVNKKHMETLD